jgi:hypothetical protein
MIVILNPFFNLLSFKYILKLYFLSPTNFIIYFELKLYFKKYFLSFLIFSHKILSERDIRDKGAEEVSKFISSLTNCPLTNFSLDL